MEMSGNTTGHRHKVKLSNANPATLKSYVRIQPNFTHDRKAAVFAPEPGHGWTQKLPVKLRKICTSLFTHYLVIGSDRIGGEFVQTWLASDTSPGDNRRALQGGG